MYHSGRPVPCAAPGAHFFFPPRRIPVRRAAIRPTFWPGTAAREIVVGWPTCWWLPPPCGCSTGFIAEPRALGQQLRLTRYLWKLLPAFSTGLSILPPPAAMPTTARHVAGTVLREPEGKRMRVFLPSSEWPTTMQLQPEARARRPRSEAFSSHMETTVPSGIFPSGITLPTASWALAPQYTNWPVCRPSTATHFSFFSL